MASRSPEAAGDGWGDDDEEPTATAHRDPATGPPESRERHLRAKVAELEAELDRNRNRVQQVIDQYESIIDQRPADEPRNWGPLSRFRDWLTG
ncbi:hypothetical protein [Haloglomus litoreum]|uniref:hypothetical protein n=1 Tax=Haloglomus litoreum TaxID=3034026 RepID=UPI0023E83819|nr:hypothetical protein [Haloglomus sp. DT116]